MEPKFDCDCNFGCEGRKKKKSRSTCISKYSSCPPPCMSRPCPSPCMPRACPPPCDPCSGPCGDRGVLGSRGDWDFSAQGWPYSSSSSGGSNDPYRDEEAHHKIKEKDEANGREEVSRKIRENEELSKRNKELQEKLALIKSGPIYKKAVTEALNYNCPITLDDTSTTGGYRLLEHRSKTGVVCSPMFVLSEVGYMELVHSQEKCVCPVCYAKLNENNFAKVLPNHKECI